MGSAFTISDRFLTRKQGLKGCYNAYLKKSGTILLARALSSPSEDGSAVVSEGLADSMLLAEVPGLDTTVVFSWGRERTTGVIAGAAFKTSTTPSLHVGTKTASIQWITDWQAPK